MSFVDIWKNIFKKNKKVKTGISFNTPLWTSSFGQDVYTSDIVIACIHAIAEECSKMIVKSIKERENQVITNEDDLNKLFNSRPNPLMTMKDLLYWTSWRLETKCNAYLYPEIEQIVYSDGTIVEKTISIFPIDCVDEVITYNDKDGKYYISFSMRSGSQYEVPYESVIHLRKHFESTNMFFGSTDRKELLKSLQTSSLVQDLIPRGLQTSMQTKGILHAKSLSDIEGLKKFKREFEDAAKSGETSISVLDVAGEFVPVNINPQLIDPNILAYLENKILKNFGVPLNILLGNATETEWASFYQKNVEPFKIEFEQASTSVLYTKEKRSFGNKIRCYDKLVQHYTIQTRLSIVKELGSRNYLSRSEQRELLGFEPDGGPEKVSLNFVDSDKANEYQGVGGGEKDEGKDPESIQS